MSTATSRARELSLSVEMINETKFFHRRIAELVDPVSLKLNLRLQQLRTNYIVDMNTEAEEGEIVYPTNFTA
jgi:hypothetical protein